MCRSGHGNDLVPASTNSEILALTLLPHPEPGNLAWACACCNNTKGSDLGTLVGQPPQLVRLFHPRTDRWAGCFLLNGMRIDPANATGEATVKLLQFNHDTRLRERETLAETGRYPTIEALARMKE